MVKPKDVLNAKERKFIIKHISSRFGFVWDDPHELLLDPSDRLYGVTRQVFDIIDSLKRVDTLGNYWGEWRNNEFRFSIEGAQRFGPIATKNVISLTKEQAIDFLQAKSIEVKVQAQDGFVIVKTDADFIGCGRLSAGQIVPFISKNRRLGNDVPE